MKDTQVQALEYETGILAEVSFFFGWATYVVGVRKAHNFCEPLPPPDRRASFVRVRWPCEQRCDIQVVGRGLTP